MAVAKAKILPPLSGLAILLALSPHGVAGQSLRIKVRLEEKVEFHVQKVVLTPDVKKVAITGSKDEVELKEFHYDKIDPVTFTVHSPKVKKLKTGPYAVIMVYRLGDSGRDFTRQWTINLVQGRHIHTEAKFSKEELALR